ncbi:aldo/keto reductase [bacterium]|nr:aldo/keto reductase [bacterium]
MNRRNFIRSSATLLLASGCSSQRVQLTVPPVRLGHTGLIVSKLAFGTGTAGWEGHSDQTKIGRQAFIRLMQQLYERGITFIDAADIYGSHHLIKEALKIIPREKVVIMSKIWTTPVDWIPAASPAQTLDRFRRELGVDVIDLVLLHCTSDGQWPETLSAMREELHSAKMKGIVKAVGVSCHHLEALKTAAQDPWTEVMLARINHKGIRMDGRPEEVMPVLQQAHENGKAILGMKIYGCGAIKQEEECEASLRWVIESGNVDSITIGVTTLAHAEQNILRVNRYCRAV